MARTPFWGDALIGSSLGSGAQLVIDLLGNLSEDERRGITVVRQIIGLWMTPIPTSGVVGSMFVDVGIGVASEDAIIAGAVPDPNIGQDRPARGWLFRDRVVVVDDADNVVFPTVIKEDSKSKRRVDSGELFLVMNNTLNSGTGFTVRVAGLIRTLYLLP